MAERMAKQFSNVRDAVFCRIKHGFVYAYVTVYFTKRILICKISINFDKRKTKETESDLWL